MTCRTDRVVSVVVVDVTVLCSLQSMLSFEVVVDIVAVIVVVVAVVVTPTIVKHVWTYVFELIAY